MNLIQYVQLLQDRPLTTGYEHAIYNNQDGQRVYPVNAEVEPDEAESNFTGFQRVSQQPRYIGVCNVDQCTLI